MTLISAENIGKSFGPKLCFEHASFIINEGDRIGLIGSNGCGKSTFMRILCNDIEYDGRISVKKGLRIARLEQNPVFSPGSTPHSIIRTAAGASLDINNEIEKIHTTLSSLSPEEQKESLRRLALLETRRDAVGSDSVLRRTEAILSGIGLSEKQFDQDASTLSGGELCRVALAGLLASEPDLWLLDEPTNHLDLAGIMFLERFLKNSIAAAVIISHDRRFLDRVTDKTWEIENGRLNTYPGNFSTSRILREEKRTAQWNRLMEQREFVRQQEAFINKWRAGTRSRQAQSRLKRLSKAAILEEPQYQARLGALNLGVSQRLGDFVLVAHDLCVGYTGKQLFSPLELELEPGEVLGIVGANGTGKTTLFSTLLQRIPHLAGTMRWGPTVQIGVLEQHEIFEDDSVSPFKYLQNAGLGENDQDRRDRLGAMLFTGDDVFKPVNLLSGGEKKRLMLTRILLEGHNVLLLDEPTNHLDIQSSEAVTLALLSYPGTVLVISHDRFFLDEIADRILWLQDGTWTLTRGGYSEAESARALLPRSKSKDAQKSAKTAKDSVLSKPAYQRGPYAGWSLQKLENRIIANEDRITQIHSAFADREVLRDGQRMRQLQAELTEIETEQQGLEQEYSKRG